MTNRQRALFYALEAIIDEAYNEIGLALVLAEADERVRGLVNDLRDDHIDRIRRERSLVECVDDAMLRRASEMERAGL